MKMQKGALAVLGALTLAACGQGPADPDVVTQIEWTKALSLCPTFSYCTASLLVSGSEAVVTLDSPGAPIVRYSVPLDLTERKALARAAAQARFDGLGPTIGCAGCLDGPVETLAVAGNGVQHKVTFGYATEVAELEPLLGQVRALAERLLPIPPPTP